MASRPHSEQFGIVRGALMSSPKFEQEHADALNSIEEQFESMQRAGKIVNAENDRLFDEGRRIQEQYEAAHKVLLLIADDVYGGQHSYWQKVARDALGSNPATSSERDLHVGRESSGSFGISRSEASSPASDAS